MKHSIFTKLVEISDMLGLEEKNQAVSNDKLRQDIFPRELDEALDRQWCRSIQEIVHTDYGIELNIFVVASVIEAVATKLGISPEHPAPQPRAYEQGPEPPPARNNLKSLDAVWSDIQQQIDQLEANLTSLDKRHQVLNDKFQKLCEEDPE